MKSPPEILSQIIELDTKNLSFLHIFNFTYCRLSSQELLDLMHLLCEVQDVYSQHNNDCDAVDLPFHITFKPDAELKKATYRKNCHSLSRPNTTNP